MTSVTWAITKALSELMQRHDQTMSSPAAVPLSAPTSTLMLSGLASTTDVDIERVAFAPFAFDPLPADVALHYDHTDQRAGRIELLAHNDRGELVISAYVSHPQAVRCNAFNVCGDVLAYTLHDTGSSAFYARVEKIWLRETSLVPNPVNARARVLRRSPPSPMSKYVVSSLEQHGFLIRGVKLIQKQIQTLAEVSRAQP